MNPIKPSFKTEIIPLLLVILAAGLSFFFYARFPERVPTHWNAAGEVDNYSSRAVGAFMMPAVLIGMYLLFMVLPYIDPKKERYGQFRRVYHFFKGYLIAFMFIIYILVGLAGLGYEVNIGLWVPSLVGILFIIIGNYMGKIRQNWFMGIRTPWTLSSEEVWNKSHRAGGKLFIAGGIILMLAPLMPVSWRMPALIIDVAMMTAGTIGYSCWLYRKQAPGSDK